VFGDPLEQFMSGVGMFARRGAYTTEGFDDADFLPVYRDYIHDGRTVVASPHKIVGPESNDLVLQLRKRGVNQVILAGMAANLCVEGHLRELIEQGFEVVVVKDATAGARIPEGDGYLAALINFRFLARMRSAWPSIAGLLGASPGDTTAIPAMLDVTQRCFGDRFASTWQPRLREMIPSLRVTLSNDPALFHEVWDWGSRVLDLETPSEQTLAGAR
jgi:malate:quinone oxidoreductase Mqo/isochorismatase family protein